MSRQGKGQSVPALVLAAGESSRFWPLSTHGHKSLHRLRDRPIIEYTVRSLAQAGVRDIVIVQSPIARAAHFPHRTVADQLGDGSDFGVQLRYVEQPEAAGQGDAILRAAELLPDDFCVVQPENINAGQILAELTAGRNDGSAGAIAAQERSETWLFGVFEHGDGVVRDIVEKPEAGAEPSKLCNMGMYLVGPRFIEVLGAEPPNPISNIHALTKLAQRDGLDLVVSHQPFFPLKYPWHLFAMRDFLQADGPYVGEQAQIQGAEVSTDCVIERDAVIAPGVRLENCLVGAGANVASDLRNCIIGAGVTVGEKVVVEDTDLERGRVFVDVKGHTINTEMEALGTVVGQSATIGDGAVIDPGVLIGGEATIAPGAEAHSNVADRQTVAD